MGKGRWVLPFKTQPNVMYRNFSSVGQPFRVALFRAHSGGEARLKPCPTCGDK